MNAGVRGTANAVCDAPNKVIGRFEERQMASIAELNDKPFIPNILNLRANSWLLVDMRLVK